MTGSPTPDPPAMEVSSLPRPPRWRYPGWRMTWALSVTETVSYGVLYYAFAALLVPMQASLRYNTPALTGAFSVSLLITGLFAIPVGTWLDLRGARALMTVGSLLGAGSLLLWAHAHNLVQLYIALIGVGMAAAATQYEPAFATINAYFDKQRRAALLTITVVAGFASTVFLPTTAVLTEHHGWRGALVWLAVIQAATAVPLVVLIRRRPTDHGWYRDGVQRPPEDTPGSCPHPASPAKRDPTALASALRYRPVLLLTLGSLFAIVSFSVTAVHLVSYLRDDSYGPTLAATATGGLGVAQVVGRVLLTLVARRASLAVSTAALFFVQVVAVAALLTIAGLAAVVTFIVLYGLGFGVLNIARADLLAQYVPSHLFARVSGVQALALTLAEAIAPTAAAFVRSAAGSYVPVFLLVAASSFAAGALFWAADHSHRSRTVAVSPRASGQ